MDMKEYIIQKLLEAEGGYVTGSSLSQHFSVTRSAIWKEIILLREQGFAIEAAPKKGYRITAFPNKLHSSILKFFAENTMWKEIIHLDTVSSTNTYLKNHPKLTEGIAVFANRQTDGRGRRGKGWHSPDEGNIYLSVSFKPNLSISEMPLMSLSAGLAAHQTIESLCGIECGIKWPNDVVAGGKKLCGILSEITGEIEGGWFCIVGIGINVNNSIFPDSVLIPATSLAAECRKPIDINQLAVTLLENLEFEYNNLDSLIERYKAKCVTMNKQVKISNINEEFVAEAIDITADGGLLVVKDGKQLNVNSGEVSVRGIYDYV